VEMEPRVLREPRLYPRVFVGSIVVDNAVNIVVPRHNSVNPLEKS